MTSTTLLVFTLALPTTLAGLRKPWSNKQERKRLTLLLHHRLPLKVGHFLVLHSVAFSPPFSGVLSGKLGLRQRVVPMGSPPPGPCHKKKPIRLDQCFPNCVPHDVTRCSVKDACPWFVYYFIGAFPLGIVSSSHFKFAFLLCLIK